MATASEQLRSADGFLVESSEGDVGRVEEVWLDDEGEPRALALQTTDGRHALLRAEDVLAVDREQHWVVVRPGQELLELEAPRMRASDGGVAATWRTTGTVVPAPSRPRWRWPLHVPHWTSHPHPKVAAVGRRLSRLPPWAAIAVLYGSLALIVGFVITLAFVVARLLTGTAY